MTLALDSPRQDANNAMSTLLTEPPKLICHLSSFGERFQQCRGFDIRYPFCPDIDRSNLQ